MIKGNKTICGKNIEDLSKRSGRLVIKICDICGIEMKTRYEDYIRSINKWQKHKKYKKDGPQDFCQKCSHIKMGGKRPVFKYLIDKRGKVLEYSDKLKKYIMEHRKKVEDNINRNLSPNEHIHHLDGDGLNNDLNNLFVVNGSRHMKLHKQLEKFGFLLYKQGIIDFDGENYILNPKIQTVFLENSYGFDHIALKPSKNICKSRIDVNIESEIIRGIKRPIPIIGSNMFSVTNASFSILLYNLGALGILHRAFSDDDEYVNETKKIAKQCDLVPVSIGIDGRSFDLCNRLVRGGANIICLDVANVYTDLAIYLGKKIKREFKHIKLIVGNTTNEKIIYEVLEFADAIKVGIGSNNSVCITYDMTGFTEGQFSAVLKFKNLSKKYGIPIISDGGCRKGADFCKALSAGANSVMLGTVLARCPESAGEVIEINGQLKKIYMGMASRDIQNKWRGGLKTGTCPEGKVCYLDIGEPVDKLLERYSGALRSAITYSGGKDIKSFQNKVEFVRLV